MDKTITDTLVKRVKEFKNNPEKVQDYLDFVAMPKLFISKFITYTIAVSIG